MNKFKSFTDNELNILADAIERYGCPNLMKQINEEMREREYNRRCRQESLDALVHAIMN